MYQFEGVFTALVTPFKNGEVDYSSFEQLVEFQISSGIQGLVVNGTTAESPTLETEEVVELFKRAKNQTKDNLPIVMGTGSNNTAKTIKATQAAEELGADGALVVTPYYNKPTQEGLYQHFKSVAENTALPVVLYNVPGRTITRIENETIGKLSNIKNIVSIKDATGDMEFGEKTLDLVKEKMIVTSGDDPTFLRLSLMGGRGVTSVISNMLPQKIVELNNKAMSGDDSSIEEFKCFEQLLTFLYIEPNPTPIKKALHFMGIIGTDEMRLPLCSMSSENADKLKSSMQELGIL